MLPLRNMIIMLPLRIIMLIHNAGKKRKYYASIMIPLRKIIIMLLLRIIMLINNAGKKRKYYASVTS